MDIAIIGTGSMGKVIYKQAQKNKKIEKIFIIEPTMGEELNYLDELGKTPDAIIDFSHPDSLDMIYDYIKNKAGKVSLVIGTTGYTEIQNNRIKELSLYAPVMCSANYSYGINLIKNILEKFSKFLKSKSDIEIVEKHHKHKADAPSGTALLLANAVDKEHEKKWKYGREGMCKRGDEIGIHSVRGGNIFGEHDILFAMEDETVEIKHEAYSKTIFANGAIEAAIWITGKKPGLYSINDMLVRD